MIQFSLSPTSQELRFINQVHKPGHHYYFKLFVSQLKHKCRYNHSFNGGPGNFMNYFTGDWLFGFMCLLCVCYAYRYCCYKQDLKKEILHHTDKYHKGRKTQVPLQDKRHRGAAPVFCNFFKIIFYWNTFLLPRSQCVSNKDVDKEPTTRFW